MKFAKKSLGQNFLIDKNIIKKIANLININGRDVIEIGPGKGALTDEILKKNPKSLKIIEKDSKLANELKIKYANKRNVFVFNDDILKFDIEKIQKKKLCSNWKSSLQYFISNPRKVFKIFKMAS